MQYIQYLYKRRQVVLLTILDCCQTKRPKKEKVLNKVSDFPVKRRRKKMFFSFHCVKIVHFKD